MAAFRGRLQVDGVAAHRADAPQLGNVPRAALVSACREPFEIAERLGWKSYDPFDVLLSPVGRRVQSVSWFGARVLVQIGKRLGGGFRRALAVPRHEEPKALADFLRAAVMLTTYGEGWAREHVDEVSRRLLAHAKVTPAGRGWGLAFPYASRFASVGSNEPNIYVTSVACQALLDQWTLTGDAGALDAAGDGARFILDGLGSFEQGGNAWLRYWAGYDHQVVNVQALAASLFARIGTYLDDERMLAAGDRAAQTVLAAQHADGSWSYADDGRAPFVDGFHTGFILQGLAEYVSWRDAAAVAGAEAALRRGFAYFQAHLITPDGLPRAFADGAATFDGQTLAQCIQTLIVCGGDSATKQSALRMWQRGIGDRRNGAAPDAEPFPALRWTVGPLLLATTYLLTKTDERAAAAD